MKRKVLGVGLFCVLLFAAILAGYWDMLNTEKLTLVRDAATNAVGEIGDVVRKDPPAAPAPAAPAASSDVAAVAPAAPSGETTPRISGDPAANASPEAADGATPTGADSARTAASNAPPAFDILRVEPDGSTVLAGTAPAGATISLRDGTTTLGTEVADASGAFVVVLDKPLAVGDHQIQIEAKTVDGTTITSAETAIVSVPEKGRENELLAMVESPDKASRLISVPKAAPVAPDAPAAAGTPVAAGATPAQATADVATPPAGDAGPAASEAPATEVATAAPTATPAPAATDAAVQTSPASLAVDAVEIEDDSVYVAGSSVGSAAVRIYVDNGFLGAADRLPGDRFLMTAKAKIATGDHTVRADALDKAGAVIARVEVPFVKPEGRAMSAISAPAAPAAPGADAPAAPVAPAVGSNDAPAVAPAAGSAPAAPAATPGSTPAPAVEAPAATASPAPTATAPVATAATPTTPNSPAVVPANPDVVPASPGATSTDVAVIRQPALESVNARVIIRRGDSLWRISRDTYGRGARYTVIYLANGDQIRDPNKIYPGQVFRMPKDEAQ